ncbi:MAG: helix-turn-helix transcriptional regulator [Anaerolineae bacterium]|nr:helix-turn-helix transcriptional regulator [Anaerolineae bacterium]
MQTFGTKLHILRTQRGMTLKELALALGYTAHGHISEIESGKKRPTVEFVLNVARLFNVSTDQLLKDEIEVDPGEPEQGNEKGYISMTLAFVDRTPTQNELQKLRLVLSTYQDGSGQLVVKGNRTLPNWRDFERSVALVFGGEAQENKAIFDVLLPDPVKGISYGLSCKVRGTLGNTIKNGRATIELSNSSRYFWDRLRQKGINDAKTIAAQPVTTGSIVIDTVKGWHDKVSIANGGTVDLAKSFYLTLQYNPRSGEYQLYQFSLNLPDPATLAWKASGNRLIGYEGDDILFEWYYDSGGQLKYYPRVENAIWTSGPFRLEPLPGQRGEYGVLRKAAEYFPDLWAEACKEP